jgi:hypothetical protein
MNACRPHHARLIEATLAATIAVATLALPAAGAGVAASATGSGLTTVAGELRTFSLVAVLRPDGVASGMAQVNNRKVGEMFQLSVDCLKVVGTVAIVSGVFTRHTDPHAVGLTGVFAVQDAGEGSPSPDRMTQVFFFEPGVLTCSDLEPADAAPFFVDIEAGNVQVR